MSSVADVPEVSPPEAETPGLRRTQSCTERRKSATKPKAAKGKAIQMRCITSAFRGVTHHCRIQIAGLNEREALQRVFQFLHAVNCLRPSIDLKTWTGRFEAHIWDSGKQVYLGGFDNEHEAALAYDIACVRFREHEAQTNFDIGGYAYELAHLGELTKEEVVLNLRRQSKGNQQNSSQYRGVTLHQKGKWEARIGALVGKKYKYLGLFANEVDAALAYDRESVVRKGLKAVTNFDICQYLDLLSVEDKEQLQAEGKLDYQGRPALPDRGGKADRTVAPQMPLLTEKAAALLAANDGIVPIEPVTPMKPSGSLKSASRSPSLIYNLKASVSTDAIYPESHNAIYPVDQNAMPSEAYILTSTPQAWGEQNATMMHPNRPSARNGETFDRHNHRHIVAENNMPHHVADGHQRQTEIQFQEQHQVSGEMKNGADQHVYQAEFQQMQVDDEDYMASRTAPELEHELHESLMLHLDWHNASHDTWNDSAAHPQLQAIKVEPEESVPIKASVMQTPTSILARQMTPSEASNTVTPLYNDPAGSRGRLAPIDHTLSFDSISQDVMDMQWLDRDDEWQSLLAMIESPRAQPEDAACVLSSMPGEIKEDFQGAMQHHRSVSRDQREFEAMLEIKEDRS